MHERCDDVVVQSSSWVGHTDQLVSCTGQPGFTSATDVNRLHADHETIEYSSPLPVTPGRRTGAAPGSTTDVVTGGAIDYVTMT